MATTREELESFHRFAEGKIDNGDTDTCLDELFELWRIENPTDEQFEENVAAVKAAVRDMENGDRGIPLDEHLRC